MKKIAVLLALAALVAFPAMAQTWDTMWGSAKLKERLNLTETEVTELRKVWDAEETVIRTARVEIKIRQAMLEKALLAAEPDLADVKRLVKEAMDFEYQIRMAQLTREIKAKAILGEKRWIEMNRLIRAWYEKQKNPPKK